MIYAHEAFGAFNPRFYGITIFSTGAPFEDLWRRFHDDTLEKNFADRTLDEICFLTAQDHESKHFHDFLVSPFGATIFGLRLQTLSSGVVALGALMHRNEACVPVPLRNWVGKDEAWKLGWIRELLESGAIRDVSELIDIAAHEPLAQKPGVYRAEDVISQEAMLSAATEAVLGAERSLKLLKAPFAAPQPLNFSVDAKMAFEAAAHVAQIQSTWICLGEPETRKFEDYLYKANNPTLRPLRQLTRLVAEIEGAPRIDLIHAMLCWCMLGNPSPDWRMGNPDGRFALLLLAATLNPSLISNAPAAPGALWDYLDRELNQPPWRQNLVEGNDAFWRRVRPLAEKIDTTDKFGRSLVTVARHVAEQQERAKAIVIEAPEEYGNPLQYLTSGAWPVPSVEIALVNARQYSVPYEPQIEGLYPIYLGANKHIVLGMLQHPDDASSDLREAMDHYRQLNHWVDYVFLDGDDSLNAGLLAKLDFEDQMKKKCLFVF